MYMIIFIYMISHNILYVTPYHIPIINLTVHTQKSQKMIWNCQWVAIYKWFFLYDMICILVGFRCEAHNGCGDDCDYDCNHCSSSELDAVSMSGGLLVVWGVEALHRTL